ncbi:uncharacterized protein [Temnothorax nylanderi]|uniref:uncharacterized protein n=1 Tax=Temnothorax nylanderi TaxID=102681 RepID=UPI003A88E4D2
MKGVRVPTTPHFKYLGVWLDKRMSFDEHVARVAPKAKKMANSLARILPNIGGAGGHVRRLYVATVHSVLLYAAPIWWMKVGGNARFNRQMAAAQKVIAIRAARAYRTVSHVGATILAEVPPIELLAKSYAETYEAVGRIRAEQGEVPPKARRELKLRAKETLFREWKQWLADPQRIWGRRVIEAVQPVLEEWVEGNKRRYVAFHACRC